MWVSSVLYGLQYLFVHIIRHKGEWFRIGNSSYLLDQLISVLALLFWLVQEKRVRLEVEHPLVVFVC